MKVLWFICNDTINKPVAEQPVAEHRLRSRFYFTLSFSASASSAETETVL